MTTEFEPQAAWSAPPIMVTPPPPAPPPRRSGWVTASAVILLVVAALSGLIGVVILILIFTVGPAWGELMGLPPGTAGMPDAEIMSGIFTGILVVIGVISLLWAGGHLAAGVGILGGRGWARITGIVLSVIGLLFGLLGIAITVASIGTTAEMMNDPAFRDLYVGMTEDEVVAQSIISTLLFTTPFVIGYVIVLVTLARSGRFFDRPPTTS